MDGRMSLPGVAWTALILALVGVLQNWLTEWVKEPWVPLAIMVLSLIAKGIDIYMSRRAANKAVRIAMVVAPRSVWQQLLLG